MDLDEMGPIDFVVVELPPDRRPDGSAFRHLATLVDSGLVRILDLRLLRRDRGGELVGIDLDEAGFHHADDLRRLVAEAPGVLDHEDVIAAGADLGAGSVGVVIVFESCWAAPFAVALRRSGALLVGDRRLPIQGFLASLAR